MSPLMMRIFDSCASRSPVRSWIGEPAWPDWGELLSIGKTASQRLNAGEHYGIIDVISRHVTSSVTAVLR